MPRSAPTLSAALVLTVCACSTGGPLAVPGPEVSGGAIGPDEAVTGDLSVLQVQLEYPLDGVYGEGEDARLFLGIANSGGTDDELVGVTGPGFADAVDDDGGGVDVPVPAGDNVYVGAEGTPTITLVDLERPLRSSQSTPVTLVFRDAGEVTVDAMVAAERRAPVARAAARLPDPAEDVSP